MRFHALLPVALVASFAACKTNPSTTSSPPPPSVIPSVAPPPSAKPEPSAPRDAGAREEQGTRAERDAGTSCALLTGPVAMPFKKNGALVLAGDGVDAVFNDSGTPHVVHVSKTARAKDDQGGADVTAPPCAVTAHAFYCPDEDGKIHRSPRGGGESTIVAQAMKATRIAAATVGGDHDVVAYVDRKHTAEGWVTAAYVVLDGGAPERVDETGATAVALAPRGDGVIAVMVDARTALTVVHARPLSLAGGALAKGEDAAIFAGNAPKGDAPVPAIAVAENGRAFAVVALPEDSGDFGAAAILLDDPPKLEEPVTWAPYRGAGGRPAIAATRGARRLTVARARGGGEDLGRLDPETGAFTSLGTGPADGDARDVSVEEDASGDVWLLVADRTGSFVERRRCP